MTFSSLPKLPLIDSNNVRTHANGHVSHKTVRVRAGRENEKDKLNFT